MLMPLAQRAVPPLAAAVVSGSTASDSTTTAKAKAATAASKLDVLGQLAASAGDDDGTAIDSGRICARHSTRPRTAAVVAKRQACWKLEGQAYVISSEQLNNKQ